MPLARVNDTMLHYHETGSGLPVLFIHPPLINSAVFQYQAAQLSDRCRVITFDIRGHGFSPSSDARLSYPLIAEDAKQLLDHLGIERAVVCGYSTGGTVALEALLSYPDRFAGGILVSGMSETSDWKTRSEIKLGAAMCRFGLKHTLAKGICRGNADTKYTYDLLYRSALKGSTKEWKDYFQESLDYNCSNRLKQLRQPILLLNGNKDKSFLRYAHLLRRRLPNNQMFLIKHVSHQLPTKAALHMNEIVRGWIGRFDESNELEMWKAGGFEPVSRDIERIDGELQH